MGINRDLARAIGFFAISVIAIGASGLAFTMMKAPDVEVVWLFLPLFIGYSVMIAVFTGGLAIYATGRSRKHRLE